MKWFKNFIAELRDRMRYKSEIAPETIRRLATELAELASLAERMSPEESVKNDRIKRVLNEVTQLIELTGKVEFHRLSAQRRLELHHSLVQSKEQILSSMQNVPTPTDRIQ